MAMLTITGGVDPKSVDALFAAAARYQTECGRSQGDAIRTGVITLVKSLRARTTKAKKMIPASDVDRHNSKPHYLTPKGKNQKSRRTFDVKRRGGSPAEKVRMYPADGKSDARKLYGQIKRHGLAYKSWGWYMRSLFNRSAGSDSNPQVRIPNGTQEGYFREIVTGPNPRVECLIHNKLGYIRDALKDGAVEQSLRAATNSINKQISNKLVKAKRVAGL